MELSNVNYPLSATVSRRLNLYKLILSVLVVYIHSDSGAAELTDPLWLENFRLLISYAVAHCAVPGFFLLSSMLLYRKPFHWKQNMLKKLRTLGIPYLILNTLWIAAFFVAQQIPGVRDFCSNPDKMIAQWGFREYANAFLGFQKGAFYPFLYPLWFVRDLLVLNVLASVLGYLIDRFPNACLTAAVAAWLFLPETGIFFMDIQSICFWALGGVLVKKGICLEEGDRIPTAVWLLAYAFLVLLVMTVGRPYRWLARLTFLTGVFFWFRVTALVRSSRWMDVLGKLSTFSFGIYLFHEFFLTFAQKVAVKLLPLTPVSRLLQYILIPVAVIALCIALCGFLKKRFPRLYGLLTGGRG